MRHAWVVAYALLSAGCDGVFHLTEVGAVPDGGAPGSGPDSGTTGPRFVFVTMATFVGDLTAGGGAGDALAAADSACQGEANTAMLPGLYHAWLSTTGTAAASRMTHTGGPFVLPDAAHAPVADSWGTFAFSVSGGGPHLHAIDVTADGSTITSTGCDVWTNTQSDGTPAATDVTMDCYEWTTIDQGVGWPIGSVNQIDSRFTASFACPQINCQNRLRLYCVQQ